MLELTCTGLWNPIVFISSQFLVQRHYLGKFKLAVWGFTSEKLANTATELYSHRHMLVKYLSSYHWIYCVCVCVVKNNQIVWLVHELEKKKRLLYCQGIEWYLCTRSSTSVMFLGLSSPMFFVYFVFPVLTALYECLLLLL